MPANTATSAQCAPDKPWGLYVHIPYCRSKCIYCDFYSVACARLPLNAEPLLTRFAEELKARLHEVQSDCQAPRPATVYIGGGTPSLLTADQLLRLTDGIDLSGVREFTVEINPDDAASFAQTLHRMPPDRSPDRISMGVQSLVDAELRAVGRRHTAAQALEAISLLRDAGIGNISCDLIYGLPGQTLASFEHSLEALLQTGIEHLSSYILSYEPSTPLTRLRDKGRITEAPETLILDMYQSLCQATKAAGFSHYEISSFACEGRESVHNSSYWHGTPYLGLGPAAHSLGADGVRRFNAPDVNAYLAGKDILTAEETSPTGAINDLIITALRTSQGLHPSAAEAVSPKLAPILARRLADLLAAGQLALTPAGAYRIPEPLWPVADTILLNLILD